MGLCREIFSPLDFKPNEPTKFGLILKSRHRICDIFEFIAHLTPPPTPSRVGSDFSPVCLPLGVIHFSCMAPLVESCMEACM
jgi:hypothetical protein